jgi:hypothetical protein
MKTSKVLTVVGLCFICFLAAGCASYYKVTDPTTGRIYYTQKVDHLDSGGARLTDAHTGDIVTIQNSEVQEITEQQFNAGRVTGPTIANPPSK